MLFIINDILQPQSFNSIAGRTTLLHQAHMLISTASRVVGTIVFFFICTGHNIPHLIYTQFASSHNSILLSCRYAVVCNKTMHFFNTTVCIMNMIIYNWKEDTNI